MLITDLVMQIRQYTKDDLSRGRPLCMAGRITSVKESVFHHGAKYHSGSLRGKVGGGVVTAEVVAKKGQPQVASVNVFDVAQVFAGCRCVKVRQKVIR